MGGDDTIRLLPYIDFDVIRNNPKIFCGFSDTTSNHFMMYKAGLISYYGASVMNNIAEYVKINDYTAEMIWNTLFEPKETLDIPSSPYYKEAILKVVAGEAKRPDLPILYNVNFGHAEPTAILPYGVKARLDAYHKTLTLLEPATAMNL